MSYRRTSPTPRRCSDAQRLRRTEARLHQVHTDVVTCEICSSAMAERTSRLWCDGPTPEKFIVQLSAVVIHRASPAENMTCLRCEVGVLRRRWVTVGEYSISTKKGASHTNHCWCQKTSVIVFSCGIEISTVLVLSQYTHLIDRQTDGQTDRQNCDSNTVRCIACSRTVIKLF